MQPSTVQGNHVERLHGSSKDSCQRCARDVNRAGGWVRVQQSLLRGRPLDRERSGSARTSVPADALPAGSLDGRILGALHHRAETQSARVKYLTDRGPAVSRPQHEVDLAEAHAAETEAWNQFRLYAENGIMGPTALEIARRLGVDAR